MIPTSYQLPALVLLTLGAIIAWAAGYRLFRFVLTLFGFYIGALAGSALLGASDRMMLIFAALGGGIAGALVMFFGYFVGVALIGAWSGAIVVLTIWSRLGSDPHAFVVILAAVAGAAAAMALQRYVIIIATAFAGGWTMLWGVMNLVDASGTVAKRPQVWMVYPLDLSPERRWVVAAWAVLGVMGMFIQLRYTARQRPILRAKAKKTA